MDGWLHIEIEHGLAQLTRFHPAARLIRSGPRIAIDGKVVSRDYKRFSVQLPEGKHDLEIWIQFAFVRVSYASRTIEIASGHSIVAEYRPGVARGLPGIISLSEPPPAPLPAARVVE
jgi:hypothetical protein